MVASLFPDLLAPLDLQDHPEEQVLPDLDLPDLQGHKDHLEHLVVAEDFLGQLVQPVFLGDQEALDVTVHPAHQDLEDRWALLVFQVVQVHLDLLVALVDLALLVSPVVQVVLVHLVLLASLGQLDQLVLLVPLVDLVIQVDRAFQDPLVLLDSLDPLVE